MIIWLDLVSGKALRPNIQLITLLSLSSMALKWLNRRDLSHQIESNMQISWPSSKLKRIRRETTSSPSWEIYPASIQYPAERNSASANRSTQPLSATHEELRGKSLFQRELTPMHLSTSPKYWIFPFAKTGIFTALRMASVNSVKH